MLALLVARTRLIGIIGVRRLFRHRFRRPSGADARIITLAENLLDKALTHVVGTLNRLVLFIYIYIRFSSLHSNMTLGYFQRHDP